MAKKICYDVALKRRTCSMCSQKIEAGQKCLHFQSGWGANSTSANLCMKCIVKFIKEYKGKESAE